MRIRRFYTFIPSPSEGGKRIEKLISDVKKAKKEGKFYYYQTNIKINLIGCLNTRTINIEKIENIKFVDNDNLKITFAAIIRDNNKKLKDKDTAITIPIKMIDSMEVDVVS